MMIEFIAKFSPRLTAILSLPKELQDVFVAVEDLIHDQSADPTVQAVLNEIHDVQKKLAIIRGD